MKPLKYVENLMEKLSWHCCWHFKNGCEDIFEAKDVEDHQKCCIYRKINCIFEDCKEQVLFKDFFDHVETFHKDLNNATKVDGKTFNVSFDSSEEALIRFEVPNFPELSEDTYSKEVRLKNRPWRIRISQESNEDKSLNYGLTCGTDTDKGQ